MNPYAPPTTQSTPRRRGAPWLFWCTWIVCTIVLVPYVGWLAGIIAWTSGFTRIDNETLARLAAFAAALTGLLVLVCSQVLAALLMLRTRTRSHY